MFESHTCIRYNSFTKKSGDRETHDPMRNGATLGHFLPFFRKYCKHENTIFGCGECHWIKFFPMLSIRFHTRRPRLIRTSLSTQIWFNCVLSIQLEYFKLQICYFKIYHFDLNNTDLEKLTMDKVLFTSWTLQNVHTCISANYRLLLFFDDEY